MDQSATKNATALHRASGQSLVEMALMLPLLLTVLFGIIDLGYYIYAYSTIYHAARNGSEAAAQLPPFPSRLATNQTDDCINTILAEVASQAAPLFSDVDNFATISYPTGSTREIGQPIQVSIVYNVEPLTPLFQFVSFGNQGVMTVRITARRSIESLGNNPNYQNGVACEP